MPTEGVTSPHLSRGGDSPHNSSATGNQVGRAQSSPGWDMGDEKHSSKARLLSTLSCLSLCSQCCTCACSWLASRRRCWGRCTAGGMWCLASCMRLWCRSQGIGSSQCGLCTEVHPAGSRAGAVRVEEAAAVAATAVAAATTAATAASGAMRGLRRALCGSSGCTRTSGRSMPPTTSSPISVWCHTHPPSGAGSDRWYTRRTRSPRARPDRTDSIRTCLMHSRASSGRLRARGRPMCTWPDRTGSQLGGQAGPDLWENHDRAARG